MSDRDAQTIQLIIHGAAGRMGRQVIAAAHGTPGFDVVAALVRPGSPLLGSDAGTIAGVGSLGVPLTDRVDEALAKGGVAIDFSTPASSIDWAQQASRAGVPTVVATTGLTAAQLSTLRECANAAPILVAPNLSVGINLLVQLLPTIVHALGDDYDIEIIEAHHRYKKDAPSGTALRLAEAIAAALERPLDELERYGRHGVAPRQKGEIGMHALRAGGIVGEHQIVFANDGEQIEVSHRAFSRETFARGALRAARFLATQPAGYYSMRDVLK